MEVLNETTKYKPSGKAPMEVVLPLDKMTINEKLQVMEKLWDDLSRNPDDVPVPAWHLDILRERQQELVDGTAKLIPWEEAKRTLRNKRR
jgi:hypothetical protein